MARRVLASVEESIGCNADSLDCALIVCTASARCLVAPIMGDRIVFSGQLSQMEQIEAVCVFEHFYPTSAPHPIT
jgi:hypothetical protein